MSLDNARHLSIGGKDAVRLEIGGGAVWKGLPKGYTKLDYIEATGTQYIDTGFIPNQDTRIVCTLQLTEVVGQSLYGARYRVVQRDFSTRIITSRWQANYGTEYGTVTQEDFPHKYPADLEVHTIDHGKAFYLDGELIKEYEPTTFTAPRTFAIGAANASNGIVYSQCRFYSFLIYDNDVLIRDYVPCKDAAGNIGMYDTVNAVFYGNAGTGEFVAGEEV